MEQQHDNTMVKGEAMKWNGKKKERERFLDENEWKRNYIFI